ncbi:MAG: M48 family metallopeptidase [Opitutales bacterium]|nr:M48 family metallopeptidase [Opitutales bacterium]
MNSIALIFIALLLLRLAMQLGLDLLNLKSVNAAAGSVPAAFAGRIEPETYARSVDYTRARLRLSMAETLYDALILAVLLLSGLLAWIWYAFSGVFGAGLWGQSATLFATGILIGLPSLPFDWYSQFRLEERFGFNRSTLALWLTDKIKGLVIGLIIGLPLVAFLLWLVGLSEYWWLWAFVAVFVFQLVMVVVYPTLIMPLFNKFTELEEGDLKTRLFDLSERTGFRARTILVMDGSKRSGHSNAFFTGFGKFRRIVLFDTLMEQLKPRQLEAVLAHEIGHYKLGHIPRMIAMSAFTLLLSFALIGYLAGQPAFVEAFGFDWQAGQLAPVLLLFMLMGGLLTFWLSPLSNVLSRKHEYEADHFAREALGGDPEPLVEALHTLSEKNLSNLTPHPLYSGFYYSHPTLIEREAALRNKDN